MDDSSIVEVFKHLSGLDLTLGVAAIIIFKAWLSKIPTKDDVHKIIDKRIDEKLEVINVKLDQIKEEISKK
jgi:hypothetical protein